MATKIFVLPGSTAGCKVTYGGRITAANGDKATFGGNAKADGLKGNENYQDHGPATNMHVKSSEILAVNCSRDGRRPASSARRPSMVQARSISGSTSAISASLDRPTATESA